MRFTSKTHTRKNMRLLSLIVILTVGINKSANCQNNDKDRPNVIVVLTDDQGYQEVGFNGNTIIKTPNLDRFASEGVVLDRFYVAPVCSPTRAGILTGRYHYRTGVTNVGSCGDRMKADEVTIAEALSGAGYATAIFGKWHLGDNYPMRPQDNGFQEAVVHEGAALTPWYRTNGDNYFDPILLKNGVKTEYKGYCMDVYTDLALEFAEKSTKEDKPFFVYLASNTPHTPLRVEDKYASKYEEMGIDKRTSTYFGMIENIDYNMGRLVDGLKKLNIDENTLIIFLADNGCALSGVNKYYKQPTLKGKKATVYEGGIKVPFAVRWPGKLKPNRSNKLASYTDIMPTILDVTNTKAPKNVQFDGESMLSILTKNKAIKERNLFIQWHQGLQPQLNRSFAVVGQKYKLVQAHGGFHNSGKFLGGQYNYELYDIENDPFEQNNLAERYPEKVTKLRTEYENWFRDVMKSRGPDPELTHIGTQFENPIRIINGSSFVEQDEHPNHPTGEWPSKVVKSGTYKIDLTFAKPTVIEGVLEFEFNNTKLKRTIKKGTTNYSLGEVELESGSDWLKAIIKTGQKSFIPTCIDFELL